MNRNVPLAQASMAEVVLPARVQEALGQLVGSAKEGLLALSVGVGLGVLAELLEEDVEEVVGAKGRHNADRVSGFRRPSACADAGGGHAGRSARSSPIRRAPRP